MKLRLLVEGIYPISNNDMYIPTARGKSGRGAFLRKSGELIDFQQVFWSKLIENHVESIAQFIDRCKKEYSNHLSFKVTLWIGMDNMFTQVGDLRSNDATNYIKAIEDVTNRGFDRDDKYNMEFRVIKFNLKDASNKWKVVLEYEPVDYTKYDENIGFNPPSEFGIIEEDDDEVSNGSSSARFE